MHSAHLDIVFDITLGDPEGAFAFTWQTCRHKMTDLDCVVDMVQADVEVAGDVCDVQLLGWA